MKKFIRVGEKLSDIYINDVNISDFSIIIPACGAFRGPSNAPEWIKKGARILQSYIFKLTEVELPIYLDSYPLRTRGKIIIGDCLRDEVKETKYDNDEYCFEIKDHNIFFNGGKRGVLYGVYTFLEKYLGFRFFSADVERILYHRRIDLNDLQERYNPPFEYRELCDWNAWDPDFSVKSKINGNFVRKLREEDGYSVGFAGGFKGLVHTFSKLIDPAKYYKVEPELYAFDGKVRNPNGLCLTNDDTVDAIVEESINWLKEEIDPSLLSISINDANMTYCRCERCQKLLNEGYNDTDLLIDFVNKVSRKLHETYPNVNVETLIYHEMVTLPNKVNPDEDIVIRYCPHAYRKMPIEKLGEEYLKAKDNKLKQSYQTVVTIEEWSKKTNKMYIWDYPYNYYASNVIYPIWSSLLDNMRFFHDHHAKGMYINGQSDNASLDELLVYLLAKLMFNPLMEKEEFNRNIIEFLEGYYGNGYQYIKEYMDLSVKLSNDYFSNAASPLSIIPKENSELYISKGNQLLKAAYKLGDKGEKNRIKKLMLTIDYYDLLVNQEEAYKSNDEKMIKEYEKKYKNLYNNSRRFGISRLCENIFLPVVKNFKQPITETIFWELKGKAYQDRNNENYPRKMYLIIPTDGNMGEEKEIEILCRTNNENRRGYINTFTKGKFVSSGTNPKWNEYKDYKPIKLKGTVTNVYEISEKFGYPLDGLFLCYVPIEQKGIFIEMNEMDPGAYITFKEIEK